MANELAGKVAIITGGASGMGAGTVERFVAEGAKVVIADVNEDLGKALAAKLGPSAAFMKVDVSSQEQIKALIAFAVKTYGALHIMMNNAGVSGIRHPHLLDDELSDFQRVAGINLLGVIAGTRDAAREMAKHGGGSVINVSSAGGVNPAPGFWAYNSMKAAVIHFTKSAAVDLGQYGVRVNCLAPSNIETPIMSGAVMGHLPEAERQEAMRKVREFLISRQPIQRQGHVNDIAEAALYFASDRSSYVTATVLPVDGGQLAGSPSVAKTFQESIKR
jgi:NAD(P)-dependent dehydrogenase (short-subunit alcohol dehydrogenase family)